MSINEVELDDESGDDARNRKDLNEDGNFNLFDGNDRGCTVVAIFWSAVSSCNVTSSGQTIAVAAFNETQSCLTTGSFSFSIIQEHLSDDWMFEAMKRCLNPSLYILHPRILSNPTLLKFIVGDQHTGNVIPYQSMKSSVWNPVNCFNILSTTVSMRTQPQTRLGYHSGYQRFASLINLEDKNIVSALSALLVHLQSTTFVTEQGRLILSSIKQLQLDNILRIDAASLAALQIFSEDKHPSIVKGFGKSKEGFSIFCLFDRTNSIIGRARLREWMRTPFCDKERIIARQNGVEMVMRPENIDFINAVSTQIKKFADITSCILKIKKVTGTHKDWTKLYHSIDAGMKIARLVLDFLQDPGKIETDKQYLSNIFVGLPIHKIENLFNHLTQAIDVQTTMKKVDDIEEIGSCGIVYIRDGFDLQLDKLRHVYDHLEDILKNAAKHTLNAVPILDSVSVQYVPQVGYLVIVDGGDEHLLHSYPDFKYAYSIDGFCCFKNSITADLDDRIGDIKADISDRQKLLLVELENALLECEEGKKTKVFLEYFSISLLTILYLIRVAPFELHRWML